MVVFYFLNFLFELLGHLCLALFGWSMPLLTSLTTYITNISIPQTFYNIFALVLLFLPTGTIVTLSGLTFLVILVKLVGSVIHALSFGLLFGE